MKNNYNLYLDLKFVSGINQAYKKTSSQLMDFSGVNLGNFAFRHGLSKMHELNSYKKLGWAESNRFVDENGKPNRVLLSCANWLGTSTDDENNNGYRALVIEKMDCPVTAVALGAQAHSSVSEFSLGPKTLRLAKVISERSNLVSVRDSFTQDALEKYGITNTIVTGCPSNFINFDKSLGKKIQQKSEQLIENRLELEDTRFHVSEYSGGNSASIPVLAKKLELLRTSPSFYVVQSPELLPLLLGETSDVPHSYSAASLLKGKMKTSTLLKSKMLHFSMMEGWLDFARTCDISVGMRIHGNMLPLQAEVPSVVIGHDSRTSGLANTMGVPHINAGEFCKLSNKDLVRVILEKNIDTMGLYDNKRIELYNSFMNLFASNGIETKSAFSKLFD